MDIVIIFALLHILTDNDICRSLLNTLQLLDCSSVITVFILSYIFLRAGYKLLHLGGAGVCLLGMLGLVLTDVLVGKNTNEGIFVCVKHHL